MKNVFSNKGRASRCEFWITCLVCVVVICVVGPMIDLLKDHSVLHGFAIFCLAFVCCWVFGCVTRKRCRDLGIDSWSQFNVKRCLDIPFKK